MSMLKQYALLCPCGNEKLHARGLCATCYSLKWQDGKQFGGLREQVLDRDERRCRACTSSGWGKRSLSVHHRIPGVSKLGLMITLCPACDARITHTLTLTKEWSELLRQLWRELHPEAHEQTRLDFEFQRKPSRVESLPLFKDEWFSGTA